MPAEPSRDALFRLVRTDFIGLIARIALSYEADLSLRRDLIQDVLLAVWLALPSYRGDASLKTFVAKIAQKRAISHVGRQSREPRPVELPPDLMSAALLPDEIAVRNDLRRQVIEAIHLLPLPQREAIVLSLEGFSYAEMSQILGISASAAMSRCRRAKRALRSIMERRS